MRLALAAGDMHDQLLVAYHLILDNRRINAEGRLLFVCFYDFDVVLSVGFAVALHEV